MRIFHRYLGKCQRLSALTGIFSTDSVDSGLLDGTMDFSATKAPNRRGFCGHFATLGRFFVHGDIDRKLRILNHSRLVLRHDEKSWEKSLGDLCKTISEKLKFICHEKNVWECI